MIQLPQLHESVLLANDRLVDRARRRARRFRLGLMTSAAVVSVGGAAVAGTALWGPVLGFEDGNRPSVSVSPVPASQSAVLGVLARDQTAADRGPVAREALASLSRQYVGVRPASVRVVQGWTAGSAIVLVPVADLQGVGAGAPAGPDQVCVYARAGVGNAGTTCFGTDDVRRGAATGAQDRLAWGLVPNGVAQVVVHTRDGGTVGRPVEGNAFTVDAAVVDPAGGLVDWLDAEGRAVQPDGGAPMRVPVGD